MLQSLSEQVWAVAMFTVSGLALGVGGRLERKVAIANVIAWLATITVQDRANWLDPQWGILVVDLCFLAALLWWALRSRRFWILPATAFQLLAAFTHLAMIVDSGVRAWAYLTGLIIWSYLVLTSLAVGTFTAWRARRSGDVAVME